MYQTIEQSAGSFINFDAQQALLPQISHSEHLIWAGRPRQGFILQPQDIFLIPFSLAWTGFAVFWTSMAWAGGAAPMALFGLPFVLVGLHLLFGRFIFDSRTRARTFYGLTDKRLLFVRGGKSQAITSIELSSLQDMTYTQRPDGRGTILFGFGLQNAQASRSAMAFSKGSTLMPMFVGIERVKEVYDQIRRAKDELPPAPTR